MRRALSLAVAVLMLCLPFSALAVEEAPAIETGGAALMEVESMRLLAGQNADKRLPMASTTKIMTALLAIEHCALDEWVTVPAQAYGVEGSSMYLNSGEKLRMSDLLYGLMLTSGNDAAIAIACHVAGSVEAFAELMNERAVQLGCMDTHFVTPNGLPDENHYTTAADLCRIAAAGMQNETFRTIVGTTYHRTASGDVSRTLKNKNKVLWQYEGGNGVKTGYTKAAGRCLAFSAERDGTMLVGVVLNCPDMWNGAYALLNYGFESYRTQRLVDAGTCIAYMEIHGGTKKGLAIFTNDAILYPIATDGSDRIEWKLACPEMLHAPVAAGANVGALTLLVNGEIAATCELVTGEAVSAADLRFYLHRILDGWSA